MGRRIRTIKPELWDDQGFGSISSDARLLFIGLLSESDDDGRFRAHPAHLKYACRKFDASTPSDIGGWLREIVDTGMVALYEHRRQAYGCIIQWHKHQRIEHPGDSQLPAPPPSVAAARAPYAIRRRGRTTGEPVQCASNHESSPMIHERFMNLCGLPVTTGETVI